MDGGTGNDLLTGDAGNDTLFGDAGIDTLYGGTGDDSLAGGDDGDWLFGDDGNDSLHGDAGDDSLYGGIGDDTVQAGTGDDYVSGEEGNDSIFGYEGNDTVDGGDGDDYINTRTSTGTGVPDVGLVHPTNPMLSYPADANPDNDRDSVIGGLGNDTILTGDDDDTIYGGAGADVIDAGFDDDLVYAGSENDSIEGGEGADTIAGDDGDDLIFGGLNPTNPDYALASQYDLTDDIDPSLTNNADSLVGGAGNDTIYGQDDADTIEGGTGNDVLDGGIDNDLILGGTGDDSLVGGHGDDNLFGEDGNDTLSGGDGNDNVDGDEGDDTLAGDAGNDTLVGDGGADVLDGGTGNDQLYGGTGNDTLTAGEGADALFGADDEDTFVIDAGNGLGDTIVGGEGGSDLDTLDLRPWGKALTNVIFDAPGAESGTVEFLDGNGDVIGSMTFSEIENVIPCFTPGSLILTDRGERRVEDLSAGDRVLTRDNGYQVIRWIGRRELSAADLALRPEFAPVRIARGALGNQLPERDMMVSPQHRMLICGAAAEMFFGEHEVLVAAKHLVGQAGIGQVTPQDGISYIHMLFDRHEIVRADGAWSESFQPGDMTLNGMDAAQREELFALFPELRDPDLRDKDRLYPAARTTLKAHEARVLLSV
jgi:Ca2+-binding RTX toxin-like protein